MTTLSPKPVPAGPWRQQPVVKLVAVLLLLVVLVAGWRFVAGQLRDATTVELAQAITCEGTQIRDRRVGYPPERIQAIDLRRGMRCTVPVVVTNTGWAAVTVNQVVLPYLGAHGGAAVKVEDFLGMPVPKGRIRSDVDGVFPVDRELGAGDTWRFDIVLRFRESGCSSDGGTMWGSGLPTLRLSSLFVPGEVAAGFQLGYRGTPDSSCDR